METLQPPDRLSARVIEEYSALLDSPPARLKFLRRAVARCHAEASVGPSRWPLYDRFRIRKAVVEELVPLLPDARRLPASVRLAFWAFRLRVPLYGMCIFAGIALTASLGYAAVRAVGSLAAAAPGAALAGEASTPSAVDPGLARTMPGYAPGQIWLVEEGGGYELYSNGARIHRAFEVAGRPRSFYAFPRSAAAPDGGAERAGAPVGIVFHTSQSHIAPFSAEYNGKLQKSSEALLTYVRDHALYHYVIDRFGQIHRIVRDDARADHAGNSVWADADTLYVNLSDSFLGVCFEAQWSADTQIAPDQINEAQVLAGRALTAVLRSKYSIDDSNCVTHAVVSVSPASRLVGFHTDWGRNFPFEALGLSDKYRVPTPSVVEFGFGHDASFERQIGGAVWPGILEAEADLDRRAAAAGVTRAAFQKRLQERFWDYRSWLSRRGSVGGDGG
jgi:hypothetical protein